MSSGRICILDTDGGFVRVLQKRAAAAGWDSRVLVTAPRLDDLVAMRMKALVFDIDRLGPGSWDFLEQVCSALPDLGVVVCSGQSTVSQRVRALRIGADDWISKPCHPEEVLARVEAVVRRHRRAQAKPDVGPLKVGEVEIRADQYQAFVGAKNAELTKREFELLLLLAEANGAVLEREEIYQRTWGYAMAHGDRSVDVYVRKLRNKLQRVSSGWSYINTHFGIGYRLHAEQLAETASGAESVERAELTEVLSDSIGRSEGDP